MALSTIKLTALQTVALKTVYEDGHVHNLNMRDYKALLKKGVIESSGMKHIVNADGIQCLIEAGVINPATDTGSYNDLPEDAYTESSGIEAPELSETETIALMLIADKPLHGYEIYFMSDTAGVYSSLFWSNYLDVIKDNADLQQCLFRLSIKGYAYLDSKGL